MNRSIREIDNIDIDSEKKGISQKQDLSEIADKVNKLVS